MPFRSSIAGGVGTLIRQWLRSPNYVAGVSGWSINKDGSAEFNSGVFRGTITNAGMFVYNGAPALGTLILAISPAAGVDSYGNPYEAGLSLIGASAVQNVLSLMHPNGTQLGELFPLAADGFVLATPSNVHDCGIIIGASGALPGIDNRLDILPALIDVVYDAASDGLQIGNGPVGKQYLYNYTWSVNAVAVGTTTPIANDVVANHNSDYPNGLVAATFTPPIAGYYDFTLSMNSPGATTDRYVGIRVNGNLEAANAEAGRTFVSTSLISQWLDPATDTATFEFAQTSGAAQNVTGKLKIARRL